MRESITTNTTADRTPQDYAIEHAEYLAASAERLIKAVHANAAVQLRIAESDDVPDDIEQDTRDDVDEMLRAVRDRIHEFRKRRDRAASTQAPAVALPDIKDMRNGPQQLNGNDRAFWVLGWNECRDAVGDAARATKGGAA